MNKPNKVEKLSNGTFIMICLDGKDTEDLRRDHMFGHLDHIEKYNDLYRVAGPLKSDDGDFYGSFFMVVAENEEEARSIVAGDPYVTCGLFETISVYPFIPACGQWMGGVTWDQGVVRANMEQYS